MQKLCSQLTKLSCIGWLQCQDSYEQCWPCCNKSAVRQLVSAMDQHRCRHFWSCAGHEFCRELRKTVPDCVVPVIMLSAKNSEENIVKGLQQGCNDFCRLVPVLILSGESCVLARRAQHLHTCLQGQFAQNIASLTVVAVMRLPHSCHGCTAGACLMLTWRALALCSKPVKRAELLARIDAHLRIKADATWVHSLVNGAMQVKRPLQALMGLRTDVCRHIRTSAVGMHALPARLRSSPKIAWAAWSCISASQKQGPRMFESCPECDMTSACAGRCQGHGHPQVHPSRAYHPAHSGAALLFGFTYLQSLTQHLLFAVPVSSILFAPATS